MEILFGLLAALGIAVLARQVILAELSVQRSAAILKEWEEELING